jgi:CHAT domain-containing protein
MQIGLEKDKPINYKTNIRLKSMPVSAISTKQEAFKIAQKEIRAKHENPYYWAGFVLMD